MLRGDVAERPAEAPPPAVSAENRTSVVVSAVIVLVLLAATAVVLTVLCIRLRDREKLRKDRADRSAPQDQEGREA